MSVHLGIEAEAKRQAAALERGEPLVQETRRWDEARGVTVSMRTKEFAHDYRYFPEPDLVPLAFDDAWIERVGREPAGASRGRGGRRLVEQLRPARVRCRRAHRRARARRFLRRGRAACEDAKDVSNWMMTDFLALVNSDKRRSKTCGVTPARLVEMLKLIDAGTISRKIAKSVFEEMFRTGKPAAEIVEEKGLTQISDEGELDGVVGGIVAQHGDLVAQIRGGKDGPFKFLVGQAMGPRAAAPTPSGSTACCGKRSTRPETVNAAT